MKFFAAILFFVFLVSCADAPEPKENAVYFWKTVFDLDSVENRFLKDFEIKKIYLRYFDVALDKNTMKPKPNATVRFRTPAPEGIEIVPTVFITENCLGKGIDTLYKILSDRILQINETHRRGKISEIQIDCDYTRKSMETYYNFLSLLKDYLDKKDIKLSVTIRLHQLSMNAPPCDYGVLMLYNTGNFRDKNCKNPILGFREAEPYLKNLKKYPLKMRAAFPNFSWQILFKKGVYNNILYNQNLGDTTLFENVGQGVYKVIRSKDIPVYMSTEAFNVMLSYGDTVYEKRAEFSEIQKVADKINDIKPVILGNTIIYDLNSANINNLKYDEYEKIFDFDNRADRLRQR